MANEARVPYIRVEHYSPSSVVTRGGGERKRGLNIVSAKINHGIHLYTSTQPNYQVQTPCQQISLIFLRWLFNAAIILVLSCSEVRNGFPDP